MGSAKDLSIDISGEWSTRQANVVVERLRAEASELGLTLHKIDISSYGKPNRSVITALCRKHQLPVGTSGECVYCARSRR
jgi:glutamate formiminotransferase